MNSSPAIEQDQFRGALSRWASGVTVVTAAGSLGPVGLTASAFSSLSLDPPLILVCVGKDGASHDPVVGAEGFAVHLLSEDQERLSNRFARAGQDKFSDATWEPGPFGAPLLEGALARLVCQRDAVVDGGDHSILIGRVIEVEFSGGRPLLYWMGGYRGITPAP
jgi:flavin reductase (DIM6/NTAB) family NADH-FMN oxidoreductase RutF